MSEDQYKALMKAGDVAAHAAPAARLPQTQPLAYTFEDFLPILVELLSPKQHLTSAPTFTPRNFLEAIQLMDDGANRRLYVYVNGSWRYSALT